VNVIIKIKGREAIPVRALPFLSDRNTMSPDVVARAFEGKDQLGRFPGLCAYRIDDGVVMPIAERWWKTGPCQKLDALSSTIRADEHPSEHETEDEYKERKKRELSKWRDKSPGLLPAGAFVFKDEYEQIYRHEFEYGTYHFIGDDGKSLSEPEHSERIALKYSPFVDDATAALILAGFESYQTPNNGTVSTHDNPAKVAQVTRLAVEPVEELPLALPVVDAPKTKIASRKTWKDVALPYVVDTFKSGQYASAKDFYKALKSKTGSGTGSPFDLGVGANHGNLFVRDLGKALSFKTLENAMPDIRRAAKNELI